MARVQENWERLVRATLRREQLRTTGAGHERHPSGLAGAVPPSLGRASNIDAILQAADGIQDEDPNVARICMLLPPSEEPSELPQQPRTPATGDLISDDDRSIAADSWSIKSEYGSTLNNEQRHADATEALAAANLRPSSDYSERITQKKKEEEN